MENKEDGILSFAIDEFPVMEDDAVEAFWIQKVGTHFRGASALAVMTRLIITDTLSLRLHSVAAARCCWIEPLCITLGLCYLQVDRHREMREQLFAKLEAEYAKSEL